MRLCRSQKLGQTFSRNGTFFGMILSALAQFSRGQQQFTLRVPFELEVILRNAGDPAPLDKGVGDPDIKRFLLVATHFPCESRIQARNASVLNIHKQNKMEEFHGNSSCALLVAKRNEIAP